ncbi:MAG: 2-amino-4-hydroxy-6-hydroxymethyldihydropteridine diphosphokinase [Campylobacterota bacterium]|nr:2-amino-4-hydroxy-6-hydroxymethyldihydropteridine diphosphokinase [Campylobacterota bacterium]
MRKILDKNLTLEYINFFPSKKKNSNLKHKVLIGIGGNVGNVKMRFKKLFLYLLKYPHIDIIQTSPLLKNPPFGYLNQEYFYNAVAIIKTNLLPIELLNHLLHIEKHFKRERSFKNAPRTLDLDIIFFESKKMYNKRLIIPHPDWKKRESVLIPMIYLSKRQR